MSGFLWAVNADGVPYWTKVIEKPESESDAQWQTEPVSIEGEDRRVRTIAATPTSAFALDSQGDVHLFLLNSPIAVRQTVETYSNQRWYPVVRWSSFTLPTERRMFSSEDGKTSGEPGSFTTKSDGWRWEDTWTVHTDARKKDKEGWEYAFNFGAKATWKAQPSMGSLVRRRLFRRHMRYTATHRWVQLEKTSPLHSFLDLTAGGVSLFNNGNFLLFALSEQGIVYRRTNIHSNNPEGDDWESLSQKSEDDTHLEEVTMIYCSPTLGTLLAITWDGRLYYREGITKNSPCGRRWRGLSTPGDQPVISVAIGHRSMWVVAMGGKIWMTRVDSDGISHNMSSLNKSSYMEVGNGVCRMSISMNDQLFGVFVCDESLWVRLGIREGEPSGRSYAQLVERTGVEKQKWMSINASACSVATIPRHWTDPQYRIYSQDLGSFKTAEWRIRILDYLTTLNEESWNSVKDKLSDPEGVVQVQEPQSGWTKSSKAHLSFPCRSIVNLVAGIISWREGEMELKMKNGNTLRGGTDKILEVVAMYELEPAIRFGILVNFEPRKSENYAKVMFAEEVERDQWKKCLEDDIRRNLVSATRDKLSNCMWTVSLSGSPRLHIFSEMRVDKNNTVSPLPISCHRSLSIRGHFRTVQVGAQRVVWAVTEQGNLYVLSLLYDVLSTEEAEYKTTVVDEVTMEVMEYQKYSLIFGFSNFRGLSSGIAAWMTDERPCSGKFSRLPTREWSWIDSDWRLDDEGCGDEGWVYAERIDGKYYRTEAKGKARRRRWIRKARFESRAPWIKVEAPSARMIRVQKQEADRILVWMVTIEGHVLVRHGVSRSCPQGLGWKHILCDYSIRTLSLSLPTCVWAVTTDNRVIYRSCEQQTDIECCDWKELNFANEVGAVCIAASSNRIWMLTRNSVYIVQIPGGKVSVVESNWNGLDVDMNGHLVTLNGTLMEFPARQKDDTKLYVNSIRSFSVY